mmetsp:Transcript_18547/g.18628  ORF Transcript_18547/g.18628 Transcript_18547/m.18628 type:complete len:502 (+) Transcript_18547:215-1720(+)|eukprot:CAMPEP_0182438530 /NCGR_PEP_ID=MMETSP1167-20130531/85839_1 /TAXON_ID=2988 /ORGANISM="Mallomonas Sp, Strain CCMP3275" /LENGTH=501 /DNA_ID=CAMNT_0024631941 /DNA_START=86 /DNA_END=1591 /DNA_ORIENTATION=+
MDPLWKAMSKLRRGHYEDCIEVCDELLGANPGDQAAWFIKCKATIKMNYIDDIELDEEGVAEMLLDENAVASMPRPGTSLNAPQGTARGAGQFDQGMRPVTQSGRPVTGFIRPSSSRPMSGTTSVRDALQSSRRSGTARPMTNLGREVRLGTASLSSTGALVDVEKLNIKKYAARTGLAMVLVDYLLYVEHNPRKALELCSEATKAHEYQDWWFKARLGKCYFKLGLLREAEKQMRSSLKAQPAVNTYLELVNVYLRLDLPNTAIDLLTEGCDKFPIEPRLILGIARVHDMLNDTEKAINFYKRVLSLDSSSIESIACLGAHYFYSDQPEMSIRYYRRLLQMGVNNTELWNNLGLCCFYAAQYDMALNCFDRALSFASDEDMADVWYNIGHVGTSLGDLGLAYQAFKVAVSLNPNHGESINNIAVLEMRRQKFDVARSCLNTGSEVGPHLFEPVYNTALLAYRMGDFQEAFTCAQKSMHLYPNHGDSKELQGLLQKIFGST